MQVFQTAGVPPNFGRIILAIIGCTRNSSTALTNSVTANRTGKEHLPGKAVWPSRARGTMIRAFLAIGHKKSRRRASCARSAPAALADAVEPPFRAQEYLAIRHG